MGFIYIKFAVHRKRIEKAKVCFYLNADLFKVTYFVKQLSAIYVLCCFSLDSKYSLRFLKVLIVTAVHLPSSFSRTLSPPSTNSIPADVTQYVHCSQRPSGAHLHLEANACTRSNVIWHKSKLSVHREQFGAKCVY